MACMRSYTEGKYQVTAFNRRQLIYYTSQVYWFVQTPKFQQTGRKFRPCKQPTLAAGGFVFG